MYLQWIQKKGTFSVPAAALAAIEGASRAEIVVLLSLAADPALFEDYENRTDELAARADCTVEEVHAAIQFWRGAGVLKLSRSRPSPPKTEKTGETEGTQDTTQTARHLQTGDMHTYSGEEVARLLDENNGSRRKLIEECQNIAGKLFNSLEINKILHLSDHMGMDNEYILLLFTYCKNRGKTSVHYVEKTALNLYDEGCDDLEKLDEYLKRKEAAESYEGQIRSAFGLGARALTAKEKKYITAWRCDFSMSPDMVRCAYDICIDATGKLSFPYIHTILERWASQKITTPEDAALENKAFRLKQSAQQTAGSSFNTDEFIELALRRSQQLSDSLK